MSLERTVLALLGLSLAACSVTTIEPGTEPVAWEEASVPGATVAAPADEPRGTAQPALTAPQEDPAAEDDGTYAEAVLVLMRDEQYDRWFCTGTLVAKDRVVTAAHCLDPQKFVSYEIVAPLAPSKPRVSASAPAIFGGDYAVVENPDIGLLTLDEPIVLPRYAVLTDVVERVEAGEDLSAVAVVRTEQELISDVAPTAPMPLSSTVQYSYEHGFGTPYFSKGGDSGAGLFLVEDGKPTHKLVGVARQPEPDRDLDHFTRIDAAFLSWYAAL